MFAMCFMLCDKRLQHRFNGDPSQDKIGLPHVSVHMSLPYLWMSLQMVVLVRTHS